MMNGIMGSLLVVNEGQTIKGLLQSGVPHDMHNGGTQPSSTTITVNNYQFIAPDGTNTLTIPSSGTEVTFDFQEDNHTVVIDHAYNADQFAPINNGNGDQDPISPVPKQITRTIIGNMDGEIRFHCGIHGPNMNGIIRIGMQM